MFCLLISSGLRLRTLIQADVLITRLFIKRSRIVNVVVEQFNKLIVFCFIRQLSLLGLGLGVDRGGGGGEAAGPGPLCLQLARQGSGPHWGGRGQVTWHLGWRHEL